MKCKNCGNEINKNEKVCPECGQPVAEKSSAMSKCAMVFAFFVTFVVVILVIIACLGGFKNDNKKDKILGIAAIVISVVVLILAIVYAVNNPEILNRNRYY